MDIRKILPLKQLLHQYFMAPLPAPFAIDALVPSPAVAVLASWQLRISKFLSLFTLILYRMYFFSKWSTGVQVGHLSLRYSWWTLFTVYGQTCPVLNDHAPYCSASCTHIFVSAMRYLFLLLHRLDVSPDSRLPSPNPLGLSSNGLTLMHKV